MSVSSSVASERSVMLQDEEMPLDMAINKVTKTIQTSINSLEQILFNMAQLEIDLGMTVDDDEVYETKYKQAVELEYVVSDHVIGLCDLLDELPDIAHDIQSSAVCPKQLKPWLVARKKERKEELDRRKQEKKAAAEHSKAVAEQMKNLTTEERIAALKNGGKK